MMDASRSGCANECLPSHVSGDGVGIELAPPMVGAQKIIRICCTLSMGWPRKIKYIVLSSANKRYTDSTLPWRAHHYTTALCVIIFFSFFVARMVPALSWLEASLFSPACSLRFTGHGPIALLVCLRCVSLSLSRRIRGAKEVAHFVRKWFLKYCALLTLKSSDIR